VREADVKAAVRGEILTSDVHAYELTSRLEALTQSVSGPASSLDAVAFVEVLHHSIDVPDEAGTAPLSPGRGAGVPPAPAAKKSTLLHGRRRAHA
jgi:hypothetical protein